MATETPKRFQVTLVVGCVGYLLLAPGIGLTTFCCAPSGSSTAHLCTWFGPYLILAALSLAAGIPLTYLAVQWHLDRNATCLKRQMTSIVPWILLVIVGVAMVGGFSAQVPAESDLSPSDHDTCNRTSSKLLQFLQDARPKHNETQGNETVVVGTLTIQDALTVEKAAFVCSGALALIVFLFLVLSSYNELVLRLIGSGFHRNLTSNLIGRRGVLDEHGGRRSSQDHDSVIGALSDGKELTTIVPERLRDGTETVHIRIITKNIQGGSDVVEIEDLALNGLRPLHTVKELEERIGLLPIINRDSYGSAPVFHLEYHGQPMVGDRRLSTYAGIFVQDSSNANQVVVKRTPSGYSLD